MATLWASQLTSTNSQSIAVGRNLEYLELRPKKGNTDLGSAVMKLELGSGNANL